MIYHVTNSKLPGQRARIKVRDADGVIVAVFFDGQEFVKSMSQVLEIAANVTDRTVRFWPDLREMLGGDEHITITEVKEEKELAVNERVALFCRLYKQHKGIAYRMSPKDVGIIKALPVTEALLSYYLNEAELPENPTTWLWRGKQSVSNLRNYWNEVMTSMQVPVPEKVKSRHPNKWDREHLRKLDGEGITEYYRHLKSLGLVPRKHPDGSTIDWVKADAATQQ